MDVQGCKRVLVVDDEHDIQEAIAEVLADDDYRAMPASNGREALEQLHAMDEKPCVILLDMKMPIMNGFQFRAAQQADPALQGIPVIILTANFQAAEVADLGAAAFVRKPFSPDALLETVNAACHGVRTPIEAPPRSPGAAPQEAPPRSAGAVPQMATSWRRVAGDRERWERPGFGAVEPRGPLLWAALPTCGHDYHSAVTLPQAQRQLEEHAGLCFSCWYGTYAYRKAMRRGQSTPPEGTDLD
jgi:CheY-like chemotaxis protein